MRGLQSNESEKFMRYFALIQAEAAKRNAVFFAQAGDGNDFETVDMEGEEVMGWLIPSDKADEFEPEWDKDNINVDDKWIDYFLWVEWRITDGAVSVMFVRYDEDGTRTVLE